MSADTSHGSDQGTMDISEHVQTWRGFTRAIKWAIIGNVIILVFLAIFRTHG